MIPELGGSAGEGMGYPLQYSWASLVDQMVKNPPAMLKAWVRYLDWGRSAGGGYGKTFQYYRLENPHGQRNLAGYSAWGCKKSDMTAKLSTAQHRITQQENDLESNAGSQ